MTDWAGTLVIGVLIMTLIVMAKTCGLSGRRGFRADASSPPSERPAARVSDITRGFRDPLR